MSRGLHEKTTNSETVDNRVTETDIFGSLTTNVISRLHDQANIEQLEHTSCTCILNAFARCLLDCVNGVLHENVSADFTTVVKPTLS